MRTILLALALTAAAACGKNSNHPKDAGPQDAGTDAPLDASCFVDASTHYEIINACTNAQKIFVPGKPPLEGSDGTLPPLP